MDLENNNSITLAPKIDNNNLVNLNLDGKINVNQSVNGKNVLYKQKVNKQHNNNRNAQLKISFLGGVGEVGKNMMVAEYGNDMIIIDCGVAFPGDDMPGVDLIIPDYTYVLNNINRVRAIVITHGHEDHIGALPYLLKDCNAPVYCSKLTHALIENKMREHRNIKYKLNIVKSGQKIQAGAFNVEFFKVTHSIAGAMALIINTPCGTWFHTGDFKMDYTPIDEEPMDLAKLSELSKKGVMLLTSDSTNAERPGFSMSEKKVGQTLDNLFAQNKVSRIIVATFASNVHRIQQILDICEKYGRKALFAGRSMQMVCETASKIGELRFNRDNIGDLGSIDKYDDDKVCIICTGSQGEPNSALSRMANGDFPKVEINKNDYIIFSASAIPGNESEINAIINKLYKAGARVIYEKLAEVHVSGHAYQEELKTMFSLLKPKFFVPCHGEFRHLKAHADLAMDLGTPSRCVVIPDLGESVLVNSNLIKKGMNVPAGIKVVDGLDVSDANSSVQRERTQLATEGMCVVVISLSTRSHVLTSKPEIITRGFIYGKEESKEFIEEAKTLLINTIINLNFKVQDWALIKETIAKTLTNFFYKTFKRKPLIVPVILETV